MIRDALPVDEKGTPSEAVGVAVEVQDPLDRIREQEARIVLAKKQQNAIVAFEKAIKEEDWVTVEQLLDEHGTDSFSPLAGRTYFYVKILPPFELLKRLMPMKAKANEFNGRAVYSALAYFYETNGTWCLLEELFVLFHQCGTNFTIPEEGRKNKQFIILLMVQHGATVSELVMALRHGVEVFDSIPFTPYQREIVRQAQLEWDRERAARQVTTPTEHTVIPNQPPETKQGSCSIV